VGHSLNHAPIRGFAVCTMEQIHGHGSAILSNRVAKTVPGDPLHVVPKRNPSSQSRNEPMPAVGQSDRVLNTSLTAAVM